MNTVNRGDMLVYGRCQACKRVLVYRAKTDAMLENLLKKSGMESPCCRVEATLTGMKREMRKSPSGDAMDPLGLCTLRDEPSAIG